MLILNCQLDFKHKSVIVGLCYNSHPFCWGGGEVDSNLRIVACFVGCHVRVSHYFLSETGFRYIAFVPYSSEVV